MDLQDLFNPIVVAKPIRGREMKSTLIPKETMRAMKVVSTKTLKEDSTLEESLKTQTEDSTEIYHEGYIDGKLYLVPDSNLQTMRDIVNLNMKRQHGNEQKQYTEFTSKFDTLLSKVDQLAESSEDEHPERDKEMSLDKQEIHKVLKELREKIKPIETLVNEDSTTKLTKERQDKIQIDQSQEQQRLAQHSTTSKSIEKSFQDSGAIPPILDDTIKYKRVRPKHSLKKEYNESIADFELQQAIAGTKHLAGNIEQAGIDENWTKPINEPNSEIFRFLISGHFKQGTTPIFIVHKSYPGSNVLENQIPDFKSHKKDGNIDIFITGKFFTEKILIEETDNSGPVININSHIIPIENQNNIYHEKFKDLYAVGPVDIALEGEFVRNNITLKYTPVLSLEIIKHGHNTKILEDPETPVTVLYSKPSHASPFDQSLPKSVQKHVHYATDNEELEHEDIEDKSNLKEKTFFEKLKNHKIYKALFFRNKDDLEKAIKLGSEIKHNISSKIASQSDFVRSKQEGKSLGRIPSSKGRARKHQRKRRLSEIKEDYKLRKTKAEILHAHEETKSPLKPEKDDASSLSPKDSSKSGNLQTPRKKKKSKKDKNKAIVENPILAQMQEFFIA